MCLAIRGRRRDCGGSAGLVTCIMRTVEIVEMRKLRIVTIGTIVTRR